MEVFSVPGRSAQVPHSNYLILRRVQQPEKVPICFFPDKDNKVTIKSQKCTKRGGRIATSAKWAKNAMA